MGYLDNTSVTIDAILTKKGREKLASGRDNFKITKFALGDDEVDYTLWNPAHSLGSSYYGEMIENMPVLEAITDENYALKYRLLTLPKTRISLPSFTVTPNSISLAQGSAYGTELNVVPTVITISDSDQSYTVTLMDVNLGIIEQFNSTSFKFTPTQQLVPNEDSETSIIIIGNETGGRVEIPVTITTTIREFNTVATT